MQPDRNVSPLGDRRENAVPCHLCRRPTWAIDGVCEDCWAKLDDPSVGAA